MKPHDSPTRLFAYATLSLTLAGTIFALVLTGLPFRVEAHGGDPTALHGCKKTRTGQLRLVGPTDRCLRSETAVDWSITGPSGPAGPEGPAGDVFAFTCPPDSVRSGMTCIDTYEASVWQTEDAPTIAKIKDGTVTLADLIAAGATQLGLASGDLAAAGCPDTGNGCINVYVVSIPGVAPAANLTWFQAAAIARNSGKRLPTNAEWQAAALGTPDGAPCIVSTGGPGLTGTAGCVSNVGAFDMVGNVWELVADWVPQSTSCPGWGLFADDAMCLSGASTIATSPGTVRRGGSFGDGANAGVFAVWLDAPTFKHTSIGFRCAR